MKQSWIYPQRSVVPQAGFLATVLTLRICPKVAIAWHHLRPVTTIWTWIIISVNTTPFFPSLFEESIFYFQGLRSGGSRCGRGRAAVRFLVFQVLVLPWHGLMLVRPPIKNRCQGWLRAFLSHRREKNLQERSIFRQHITPTASLFLWLNQARMSSIRIFNLYQVFRRNIRNPTNLGKLAHGTLRRPRPLQIFILSSSSPSSSYSHFVPHLYNRSYSKMSSATTFYDLKPLDSKGETYDFDALKGKVVLIVNVASK